MKYIADLQIHSKYSRAVSKEMEIPKIWEWARIKGIDLIATGDWTHPLWMREIKAHLEEMGNGLLKLKTQSLPFSLQDKNIDTSKGPFFVLPTEISSIYSQGGKLRRIHNLIWVPKIETADRIIKSLIERGARLNSDGRPITGLTSINVAEIVFGADTQTLLIPAHAWTPWFSLFGSESGFDSIDECYGSYAKHIHAIETGLSSDPIMNWRIKDLDNRSLVSFSDAHSGPKLGREATVFELSELSFNGIREAIINKNHESRIPGLAEAKPEAGMNQGQNPQDNNDTFSENRQLTTDLSALASEKADNRIAYTIEFHPEEGKYHYTGHRNCGIRQNPEETKEKGMICPVCGKKLTIGVMHRVEQLAGRTEKELRIKNQELGDNGIKAVYSDAFPDRPPFISMVPLQEILAECLGGQVTGQKVKDEYKKLTEKIGNEFALLMSADLKEIAKLSGEKIAEGISKVRDRDIVVDPGYDGVFGVVKIWGDGKQAEKAQEKKEQLSII